MRFLIGRRSAFLTLVTFLATITFAAPPDSVTGEVVETYCWSKVRVGGAEHAACGIECVKRGIPAGIYDAQAQKLFILLPGRDKMSVPPQLIAAMGQKVRVRGEIVRRGGTSFIAVQSWERVK